MFPNTLCRYGYVTNSKVKFVMVVDSSNTALRDNEIRSVRMGLLVAWHCLCSALF